MRLFASTSVRGEVGGRIATRVSSRNLDQLCRGM